MIPYVRSLEIVGIKSRMHYFNNGALGGASIKRLKLLVNFSAKGTDIGKLLKDMEVSDLLSGTPMPRSISAVPVHQCALL